MEGVRRSLSATSGFLDFERADTACQMIWQVSKWKSWLFDNSRDPLGGMYI